MLKKIAAIILTSVFCGTMIVGCGNKITPESLLTEFVEVNVSQQNISYDTDIEIQMDTTVNMERSVNTAHNTLTTEKNGQITHVTGKIDQDTEGRIRDEDVDLYIEPASDAWIVTQKTEDGVITDQEAEYALYADQLYIPDDFTNYYMTEKDGMYAVHGEISAEKLIGLFENTLSTFIPSADGIKWDDIPTVRTDYYLDKESHNLTSIVFDFSKAFPEMIKQGMALDDEGFGRKATLNNLTVEVNKIEVNITNITVGSVDDISVPDAE